MRIQTPYDEDYGTCSYTHAWLRVMSDDLNPNEITHIMGVSPTETQRKGEPWTGRGSQTYKKSGWWISTQGILTSRDARHHFDWILERIRGKKEAFRVLHSRSYLVDVCCRWDSKSGHGGPTLSPLQMQDLAELEIEVWFDVYVGDLDVKKRGLTRRSSGTAQKRAAPLTLR